MKKALSIFLAILMMAAMSVFAFAENFVSSIEAKPAPEMIQIKEGDNSYCAVIIDRVSEAVQEGALEYDPNAGNTILEFVIVSTADKADAVLQEIRENITNAEKRIKDVDNLGKLDKGIAKDIEKVIDTFYGDSKEKIGVSDLIVSDLFDASLIRDKVRLEQVAEGQKVRFMIKPNFAKTDFFVLLHNTDGSNWEVVNEVEWTEEGNLVVTVDKLSVFAIAVNNPEKDPHGPDSQTEHECLICKRPCRGLLCWRCTLIIIVVVLCVVVGVSFLVKSKKTKKNEEKSQNN